MKQGSNVHRVLEEQVHTEVPVQIETREDAFGLRIWNIIQGLRTLRTTGLTRELEIWSVLDGEVVNGIIDEVSTTCPDEALEAGLQQGSVDGKQAKSKSSKPLEADQRTLAKYLTSTQMGHTLESPSPWLGNLHEKPKNFYLTDVKTRQSKTVPSDASRLRPTYMQLMMYRQMLITLASDKIVSTQIFDRYRLQQDQPFSDVFLARIASLSSLQDFSDDHIPSQGNVSETVFEEIFQHNTLIMLWQLLVQELQQTFADPVKTISPVLTAEFRSAEAGDLLGRRSFAFDSESFNKYVDDEMRWWRGERETKGVDIEEAYKCRICEFADACTWRADKVEKAIEEARRKAELKKSKAAARTS